MKRPRSLIAVLIAACLLPGAVARELRLSIPSNPKTFDSLQVTEQSSELIRYLTGGVLVRVNRVSDRVEPELAESWKIDATGRAISFHLRKGLRFSNSAALTANDVLRTFEKALDAKTASPVADAFRTPRGNPEIAVTSPLDVTIRFPMPKPGIDRLFDGLSINAPESGKFPASAGPFYIFDYVPGEVIRLARNSNYWKHDSAGRRLPYLDAIRIDIQPNHEIELNRFLRGELDIVPSVSPEGFERILKAQPAATRNVGPSLNSDFLWFNQSPSRAVPEWKRKWFTSAQFRRAISMSINRDDLVRVAYRGYAHPASSPVSPANKFWFNAALKPPHYDPASALRTLADEGFSLREGVLRDAAGHVIEFSLITNSGNREREAMAALIQEDLRKIGITLNIVTLDFNSFIERITTTSQYEAGLLGMANEEVDPAEQMDIWLSSGSMHAWWPAQKTPATLWEAEIDKLELMQASEPSRQKRKRAFDEVQRIIVEQQPVIELVNPDIIAVTSASLRGLQPVAAPPQFLWNIEWLN
jgi:peptide/nickel transport system substrate-binding protein